jgi:hypothetical protein
VFDVLAQWAVSRSRCRAGMAASPDEVQLFGLLVEMLGAKNAIEVGVFTGYSLLATALALPDDGKVHPSCSPSCQPVFSLWSCSYTYCLDVVDPRAW